MLRPSDEALDLVKTFLEVSCDLGLKFGGIRLKLDPEIMSTWQSLSVKLNNLDLSIWVVRLFLFIFSSLFLKFKMRKKIKLFHLNVQLDDSKTIPIDEIGQVPIDDFILPPRGKSKEEEFDLLSHLELEKERAEDEEEEADDPDG
jgi:hypothetical protein